jgi:NADPH:quinone reductase-like Zn-dependent oxidoreductase
LTAYLSAVNIEFTPHSLEAIAARSGSHPEQEKEPDVKTFVVEKYGQDSISPADRPEPKVGERDVLVRVVAAGINPLDKLVRNGEFKQLLPYRTPFVLGHDVAGVVTAVGPAVTQFSVGDEIYARPRDLRIGTFAERIAIDEADVALKPSSLSMDEAAAVPLVALAAWQALVDLARVRPGQRVLVHAGAGGLGATVIQLAKHLRAYVATTARGADEKKVRDLGADEVIDYTTTDFSTVLSGYDVVLDSLGGANLEKSLTVLAPGGLAISVVGPPDPDFASQLGHPLLRPVLGLLSRKIRKRAAKLGVRYAFFFMHASGSQLTELARLYDDSTLRPTLDRTFPFDRTPEALAYVEQGKAKGKVVVTLSEPGA